MNRSARLWETQTIPYEFNLCLSGSIHELERLTGEIGRFCGEHSLPDDVEFQLNLVLEELFVNAVRHGGCEGIPEAASVRIVLEEDGAVQVSFSDRGGPFDLTAAPDADIHAPLSERQAGGLGIHLVRQIMRDVSYRREGEWNILSMRHSAAQSLTQRHETL